MLKYKRTFAIHKDMFWMGYSKFTGGARQDFKKRKTCSGNVSEIFPNIFSGESIYTEFFNMCLSTRDMNEYSYFHSLQNKDDCVYTKVGKIFLTEKTAKYFLSKTTSSFLFGGNDDYS